MRKSFGLSKVSLRVGCILMVTAMGLLLAHCEAHHPITAQYVAQGLRAHSVTVLPIEHPDLPQDKAMEQAEKIAQRIREMHPDVMVTVGTMPVGQPIADVMKYAKEAVGTQHFVHGHIWDATPKRPYNEIEITERITRNGREVWSLSAKFDDDGTDSEWQSAMDEALDAILMRLPGGEMSAR
ncbi:MAG: hypothetical protein Kow0074_06180 [Candidatus Zixiibacteriota bacterium]